MGIHTNGLIDVALIAAIAFHATFGIRAMLIDIGWVGAAQRLTVPMSALAHGRDHSRRRGGAGDNSGRTGAALRCSSGDAAGQDFDVEVSGQASVLDVLRAIVAEPRSNLVISFIACRVGMCGTCAIVIDGRERLACQTPAVETTARITLEPLRNLPVIKDLVTDAAHHFLSVTRRYSRPVTPGRQLRERMRRWRWVTASPAESVCLRARWRPSTVVNVGPAALFRALRLIDESEQPESDDRLRRLADSDGHLWVPWSSRLLAGMPEGPATPPGHPQTQTYERPKSGVEMNDLTTDILILGSGGAGLFAALRSSSHPGTLSTTLMVKGSFGKSGCTRMVQGGFNAALQPGDSTDTHLRDTIVGGAYLNNQDLARALTTDAPERILELEQVTGMSIRPCRRWRVRLQAVRGNDGGSDRPPGRPHRHRDCLAEWPITS